MSDLLKQWPRQLPRNMRAFTAYASKMLPMKDLGTGPGKMKWSN